MLSHQNVLPEITHLSNTGLMRRKQIATGIEAQSSYGLGNTLPSWSFRSAQPWPSGNQIQSDQINSLRRDSILIKQTEKIICGIFFTWKQIRRHFKNKVLPACFMIAYVNQTQEKKYLVYSSCN